MNKKPNVNQTYIFPCFKLGEKHTTFINFSTS